MSNPYESPQFAGNVPAQSGDRDKLRRVARYQQWVLYALLGNIGVNVAVLGDKGGGFEATGNLLAIVLGLPIVGFAMFAIFMLAREVYNVAAGIVCAILMIVPCISLLTLLVVNGKATSYLQARGVKVGLMGANPELI
jgi:hypothetical protein